MGDIARHRDIFLNTREGVPADVLARCGFTPADLTYLELGNYFTDVSQFRDPVFYLFAKQTVWREKVLPGADKNGLLTAAKAIGQLLALGGAAALERLTDGPVKASALLPLSLSPILAGLNNQINDLAADLIGVDEWIDRMLGKPVDKVDDEGKRDPKAFGFVGQFFEHFIEGITHMLFANDVAHGPRGVWAQINRIPPAEVAAVFDRVFTQYFPHEHTDQPPYVWDASQRPANAMYQPAPKRLDSPRGVMNIVYEHYINYLSEGLSRLEKDWPEAQKKGPAAKHAWLVDLGKILHGIEDWYFHSNIVELIRIHAHRPDEVPEAARDTFVRRTILEELSSDPAYLAQDANRKRLQRFFYRRLRFPVYARGNRENSGGIASTQTSDLNWNHAYPAFPSTLDTAHTLLGALEGIESKLHFRPGGESGAQPRTLDELLGVGSWINCVMEKFHGAGPEWKKIFHDKATARGVNLDNRGAPQIQSVNDVYRAQEWSRDVLRELMPLVLTLLNETERKRLVADLAPADMPLDGSEPKPKPGAQGEPKEVTAQLKRHAEALKPRTDDHGVTEHNYARAARYAKECGSLNEAGLQAILEAFKVDVESEKKKPSDDTPGAGGFLIEFAVKLQTQMNIAERRSESLDQQDPFSNIATDNGSDNEVIGSHSLMSKDTKASTPFFDDARVLGSVGSLTVFQLLLSEVAAPGADRLHWQKILRYLIRFPVPSGGWERQAIGLFRQSNAIPRFADLPDLATLNAARIPENEAVRWRTGERAKALRQMYVDLEKKVARYRFP